MQKINISVLEKIWFFDKKKRKKKEMCNNKTKKTKNGTMTPKVDYAKKHHMTYFTILLWKRQIIFLRKLETEFAVSKDNFEFGSFLD